MVGASALSQWAAVGYLLLISLAFFLVPTRTSKVTGLALVVICILVRALPTVLFPYGARYDIDSYDLVGQTLLAGRDVYREASLEGRYPYLPGWDLFLAGTKAIAVGFAPMSIDPWSFPPGRCQS